MFSNGGQSGVRIAAALFACVALVFAIAASLGTVGAAGSNVVNNGDFGNGKSGWTNRRTTFNVGTPGHNGPAAHIANNTSSSMGQLLQSGISLQPNTEYEISFWARSDGGDNLRVFLQKGSSPFTNYGLNRDFDLTDQWKEFTFRFNTKGFSSAVNDGRLRFRLLKGRQRDASIDDVVLRTVDGTTPPGPTPTPPPPGPGNRNDELLVFDWNRDVTTAQHGFPKDKPPRSGTNFDWTKPRNFAQGTFYYRVEIFDQPEPQVMKLEFCFWQYNTTLENCGKKVQLTGNPGTVVTWSGGVAEMWKKNGNSIDWENPRDWNGMAIKNQFGKPVSDFKNWNWNGEDPAKWYPLKLRFLVVVVEKGGTFDGWDYYLK